MITPKSLRKATDYRDLADKAIKSGAKELVNTYLDKYSDAAAKGKYELEVEVPKLYAAQVIKRLKSMKMVVVRADQNKNVIVKAYWGPSKKPEIGVTLTPTQWVQNQTIQGFKRG
jgi:ABC-type uncharacterized transport system YnjBCD substrate-binding protein